MTITVEVLSGIEPTLRWTPVAGPITKQFIGRKAAEFGTTEAALEPVLLEAHTILGRCVPPTDSAGSETGLVVGYVQSGKTLSFTTVTALARDNGYGLVILLAGAKVNLKDQSERRLARDLGLDDGASKPWTHLENPSVAAHRAPLKSALTTWKSSTTPETRRRAVLVTVLKHAGRLKNLVDLLKAALAELLGVPVLIIDDEGDQAGLNNFAARNNRTGRSDMSAVYEQIFALKRVLPHHTFLQYTATPQANLLLSLADVLSPSFSETVTPGDGYVGGGTLFAPGSSYSLEIPARDVPSTSNPLRVPPASLLRALRLYILGACAFASSADGGVRSMMVHPSGQTSPHSSYLQWVTDAIHAWKGLVALPDGAPPKEDLKSDFLLAYRDLSSTTPDIPPFDELLKQIEYVLNAVAVREVNSASEGGKAPVKWSDNDFWILVGGNKLDRGFTVEGLTVTYMPRPIGTGNADTLQQRARFFGYKRKYLGYCRIFLPQVVKQAFESYVEHEEFIRNELTQHRGEPLADWKREFILDTRLNATRASVIGLDIVHIHVAEWCHPSRPYIAKSVVAGNRATLDEFIKTLRARYTEQRAADQDRFRDRREGGRDRNRLFDAVPLELVIDELLAKLRMGDVDDAVEHSGLLVALNDVAANYRRSSGAELTCTLFLVDNVDAQNRSLAKKGINEPFSGKTPNTSDQGKVNYFGDRALVDDQRITVHLRTFNLKDDPGPDHEKELIPWYGVLVPTDLAKGIVVERPRD